MRRPTPHLATLAALIATAVVALPGGSGGAGAATDGTIANLAGSTPGFAGDGGPAGQALLDRPDALSYEPSGTLLIADTVNQRIRAIGTNGIITTIAGDGDAGLAGDGGPAGDAELDGPLGVAALPSGGFVIADTLNGRIRKVAANGTITTIAGTTPGFGGDGGPATSAQLNMPSSVAVAADGSIIVADTANNRIRRIAPNGTISTIAGSTQGFGGDGGPATSAQLNQPAGVAVADDGSILIADTGNDRIRRIDPTGVISTPAGDGAGFAGDGDPARFARLDAPLGVAALPHGGFLFTDSSNDRVRRVTPLGAIFTVAGSSAGNAGNGGLAKQAQLDDPSALTLAPGGGFAVADTANSTVRKVSDIGAIPPAVVGHSIDVSPGSGTVMVHPVGFLGSAPLLEPDLIPVGSSVATGTGSITVQTAVNAGGTQQSTDVFGGSFTINQAAAGNPPAQFRLPALGGCPTTTSRASVHAARKTPPKKHKTATKKKPKPKPKTKKKPPPSNSLWVADNGGNWQTATGSVTAAALGTRWHTTLSCAGTRITVTQGIVSVRDKLHRKTTILHVGQSLLVKTPGAHAGL